MAFRPRHGTTRKARHMSQEEWDEALRRLRKGLGILGGVGWVLLVLWLVALLYRNTPLLDIVGKIGLMMPGLVFAFGFINRGTIRFDSPQSEHYPTIVSTLLPYMLVVGFGFLKQTFVAYSPALMPTAVMSILVALCIFLVDPKTNPFSLFDRKTKSLTMRFWKLVGVLVVAFFMSFVWIMQFNVAFDPSPVNWHSTSVQDKHISRNKYTTFTLTIAPWDKEDETHDLQVSAAIYHKFEVGEAIRLGVKEGLLGVPWMADIVPDP